MTCCNVHTGFRIPLSSMTRPMMFSVQQQTLQPRVKYQINDLQAVRSNELREQTRCNKSRQVIIKNDMHMRYAAYPTRPFERDYACETQLFPFCHAGLSIKAQQFPIHDTTVPFQHAGALNHWLVPIKRHSNTRFRAQQYPDSHASIFYHWIVFTRQQSAVCTIVDSEPKLDHYNNKT